MRRSLPETHHATAMAARNARHRSEHPIKRDVKPSDGELGAADAVDQTFLKKVLDCVISVSKSMPGTSVGNQRDKVSDSRVLSEQLGLRRGRGLRSFSK